MHVCVCLSVKKGDCMYMGRREVVEGSSRGYVRGSFVSRLGSRGMKSRMILRKLKGARLVMVRRGIEGGFI